jgi:hypothetical protein
MNPPVLLFHYGPFQPLWQQKGLIQCGPRVAAAEAALPVPLPEVAALQAALRRRGLPAEGVLIHYTDPFLIRAAALRGLQQWRGPRLLVCGDLHHGPAPIETLQAYLAQQFHDAVLLAFNPMLLAEVQRRLSVPVHCHPPGFFRYPRPSRAPAPLRQLLHVGSLGPHHPRRRSLVEELQRRGRIPFRHVTTETPEQAAELYAAHALVLNVPLHNDLNHRVFEVMAAGAPQILFGSRKLLGPLQQLAGRPDLFWAEELEQLEQLAACLLADPNLTQLPVAPPPEWPLQQLLRRCFGPAAAHTLD